MGCCELDGDFVEGVRALLMDKDNCPKWNPDSIEKVTNSQIEKFFKPLDQDLDVKLGRYNDRVSKHFKFSQYPDDTLAFCITSVASMFECGFLPYVARTGRDSRNSLDDSIEFYFQEMMSCLSEFGPITFKDSDIDPVKKRPKFIAQTAGHISGTCFYYQPEHILKEAEKQHVAIPWWDEENNNNNKSEKVFGVCIHPKYGGWFAIRGLLILQSVRYPTLQYEEPPDVIDSIERKLQLLNLFNFDNWKNWKYRDVIQVDPAHKYSQLQRQYFETEPKHRNGFLEKTKALETLLSDET